MIEIISHDELIEYLRKDDIVPDDRTDIIRKGVCQGINTRCNRIFGGVDGITERYSVREPYQTKLFVRNPPVRGVTSIAYGRTSPTTLSSDGYYIDDEDSGIISFDSYLQMGLNNHAIVYDGGFSPVVPYDIKLVALGIIGREVAKVHGDRHGMRSRDYAGGGISFFIDGGATKVELDVLDSYTRRVF